MSIEPTDFYDIKRISEIAVSPDGERIAYTVSESDEAEDENVTSLFVVPSDGSDEPYRLTHASNAESPKWSPHSEKLGFMASRELDSEIKTEREDIGEDDEDSEREEEEGYGEEESQVWFFDMVRGGDACQVTTFEHGVEEFDWGPEGERIVAAAPDPTEEEEEYLESREEDGPIVTERLQHKANGEGWLDTVTTYLFVVDIGSRDEHRLDDAYKSGAYSALMGQGLQPAWGDERIAFVSNYSDSPDDTYVTDIFTVDSEGGDLRKLTDSDLMATYPTWNPDSSSIAFVGGDPENLHIPTEVYVAEDTTGSSENPETSLRRSLSPELDYPVIGPVEWMGKNEVVSPVAEEGRTRLMKFGTESNPERVFEDQGDYQGVSGFDFGGEVLGLCITEPESRDLYSLSVGDLKEGGSVDRLTWYNPEISEKNSIECERVAFENSEGTEVEAIVYFPPEFHSSDDSDKYPLITSIHGGPMAYDEPVFRFDYHYWTSEGYIVLCVNYRGSTSYGREFSETIRGDWGPRETDDIKHGIRYLIEEGWVDEDRIFVTGFSQGGVNTLYMVTRTDIVTAAAPQHGIYDFYSSFGTDDSHVWWEKDFGLPWENLEKYRETSTITDVDKIETPLLITAGGEDWRCPPSQAEQLYVSAKKRDIPAKLVFYPDLHHERGGPDDVIDRIERITDWFREYDPEYETEG